jgi:hypothetical protein
VVRAVGRDRLEWGKVNPQMDSFDVGQTLKMPCGGRLYQNGVTGPAI